MLRNVDINFLFFHSIFLKTNSLKSQVFWPYPFLQAFTTLRRMHIPQCSIGWVIQDLLDIRMWVLLQKGLGSEKTFELLFVVGVMKKFRKNEGRKSLFLLYFSKKAMVILRQS